ncbi:MAG: hypothetical protein OXI48_09735 [bacterium]|nr:hypothetical protein [bacterium]
MRDEVFAPHPDAQRDAPGKFFSWLVQGGGVIVVGGTRLRAELFGRAGDRQRRLFEQLVRAEKIRDLSDGEVDRRTEELRESRSCQSDDEHIIALAQVSGARLLYSNDRMLHEDFKAHLKRPRGKVYSTLRTKTFTSSHRDVLKDDTLCSR